MHRMMAMATNWLADATGIRVVPDRLEHPRDGDVETLKIPGYCQAQAHTCGFVAGLMILHYFRPDVGAERFYAGVRCDKRWGVSRRRLMETLRLHGVRVTWRRDLDFKTVTMAIDKNRPIATVVRTRDADVMHWVVIYGYRRRPNTVFVAANGLPVLSQKEYPWDIFRNHYWATPGSGLVCAGPQDK